MNPQQLAELKQKLISQIVAKKWQNLNDLDLDLGYNLLSVEQKNTIAKSLTSGDHSALELIRSFLIEKITEKATLAADEFIVNNPSAAVFVANIL